MNILPGIVGLLLAGAATAQLSPFGEGEQSVTTGGDVVRIEPVTDLDAVPPGATLTVGLRFAIEDQWHVYWRNPGDSGMPPRVAWTLPEGWEAGELMWPLPKRFDQPGGIAGYGYGERLLLLTEIKVPADAAPNQSATIGAKIEYLVCDDSRCVPGEAEVSASVNLAAEARASDAVSLIERWRTKLPAGEHLDAASTAIEVADKRTGFSAIRVRWASEVTSVEAFPAAAPWIDVTDLSVEHQNRKTEISVAWRALAGGKQKPAGSLPILLTWVNPQGEHRGAMVHAPLADEASK